MTGGRSFIIHNPMAGQRRQRRLARLVQMMGAAGFEISLNPTHGAGEAGALITSCAAQSADMIIVAGGDGTLNDAVNGLVASNIHSPPIMFAPLGTANVMAHELNYPKKFTKAMQALMKGSPQPVRLAQVRGGRHFMLMVSVGLDAWAVAGVNHRLKKLIGPLAYIVSGAAALKRYFAGLSYQVSMDGGPPEDAVTVVVARGRKYGGPFVIAPDADLRDDLLHVVMWRKGGLAGLVQMAWGLLTGRLAHQSCVSFHTARHVTISGSDIDPVQMDGDHAGHLPLDIAISDVAVPLIYPAQ